MKKTNHYENGTKKYFLKNPCFAVIYSYEKNTAYKTHFLTFICAPHGLKGALLILVFFIDLGPVVGRLGYAIHRINRYPVDQ